MARPAVSVRERTMHGVHGSFRVGWALVFATSEAAARDLAPWLEAVGSAFERGARRRPTCGAVLAVDVGETMPRSRRGWAHESLAWAARAFEARPPEAGEVAGQVRELEEEAVRNGVPNAGVVVRLLLGHRSTVGTVEDVARAVGVPDTDLAGARWGAAVLTPRAADALTAKVVAAGFDGVPPGERLALRAGVGALESSLRASLEAEVRGVLRCALLLDEDPGRFAIVERRIVALEALDIAASRT